MTFADLWFLLIGSILFLHLGLGSIDLGICLLSLFVDREQAESMLASVDAVWHTNQTWLVVLGAVLFGAFPKVYGAALSSRYGLVILLLLALGLRGLGLEYRHRAKHPVYWLRLAGWGGVAVLASEGLLLGNLALSGGAPAGWFGLESVSQPQYFPAMLLLFFSGLLMGGSWWLATPGHGGEDKGIRPIVLVSGLGLTFTGVFCCLQLVQAAGPDLQLPWRPLSVLAVIGLSDLAVLFASLRSSWHGSPLPWGLVLMGVVLTAFGVLVHATTGSALEGLASGDLLFLTVATCVLLPPLLAFQIFQYRLERRVETAGEPISTPVDEES